MAAPVGAIAQRVRGILPVTWDALLTDSRDFGELLLQDAINLAKESVTGEVIDPTTEEDIYSITVADYIAKIAAIEIIPGAIDFWMNEETTKSATGTNETISFTDRAEKLENLRQELLAETREKAEEIAAILGYRRPNPRRIATNTLDDLFLTPSPQEFERPFRQTEFS